MPKKKKYDIDNDPDFDTSDKAISNSIHNQLMLFVERIENLAEEKKGIADDMRDVFAEAKSQGFDTKTMKRVITLRKMDKNALQEMDALEQTYRRGVGLPTID